MSTNRLLRRFSTTTRKETLKNIHKSLMNQFRQRKSKTVHLEENSLRIRVRTSNEIQSIQGDIDHVDKNFGIQETKFWLENQEGKAGRMELRCLLRFGSFANFNKSMEFLKTKKYEVRFINRPAGFKTSERHGVSWVPERRLWRATIELPDGKKEILGFFKNIKQAAQAYDRAAWRIYGQEKVRPNFQKSTATSTRQFFESIARAHPQGLWLTELKSIAKQKAPGRGVELPASDADFFKFLLHHAWRHLDFTVEKGTINVTRVARMPAMSSTLLTFEENLREVVERNPGIQLFQLPTLYRQAFGDFPPEKLRLSLYEILFSARIHSIQNFDGQREDKMLNPNSRAVTTLEQFKTEILRSVFARQSNDKCLTYEEVSGLVRDKVGRTYDMKALSRDHILLLGGNHVEHVWKDGAFVYRKAQVTRKEVSREFARDAILKHVRERSLNLTTLLEWFRKTHDASLPFTENVKPFLENSGLHCIPTNTGDYLVSHKDNVLNRMEMSYVPHHVLQETAKGKDKNAQYLRYRCQGLLGFVPQHLELLIMDRYQRMVRAFYTADGQRVYQLRPDFQGIPNVTEITAQSISDLFEKYPEGVRLSEFCDAYHAVHKKLPAVTSLCRSLRNLVSVEPLDGVDYKVVTRNAFTISGFGEIRKKLLMLGERGGEVPEQLKTLAEQVSSLENDLRELKASRVEVPVPSTSNFINTLTATLENTPAGTTVETLHKEISSSIPFMPLHVDTVGKFQSYLGTLPHVQIDNAGKAAKVQVLSNDDRWKAIEFVKNRVDATQWTDVSDLVPEIERAFPALRGGVPEALRWGHRLSVKREHKRLRVCLPVSESVPLDAQQVRNLTAYEDKELNFIRKNTGCMVELTDSGAQIRGVKRSVEKARKMLENAAVDRQTDVPLKFWFKQEDAGKLIGVKSSTFNEIVANAGVKMEVTKRQINGRRRVVLWGPIANKIKAKNQIEAMGIELELTGPMPKRTTLNERVLREIERVGPMALGDVQSFLETWTPNFHHELYKCGSLAEMLAPFEGLVVDGDSVRLGERDAEQLDYSELDDEALAQQLDAELKQFNVGAIQRILLDMKGRGAQPSAAASQELLQVACRHRNQTFAFALLDEILERGEEPNEESFQALRVFLGPERFERHMKGKISDQRLGELTKNARLLDTLGNLQVQVQRAATDSDLESIQSTLQENDFSPEELGKLATTPWNSTALTFELTKLLLKKCTEKQPNKEGRKALMKKLKVSADKHVQTWKKSLPDDFFTHLEMLQLPSVYFTSLVFRSFLERNDFYNAKQWQLRFETDLPLPMHREELLLCCAQRGTPLEFQSSLGEFKEASVSFDRDFVTNVVQAIATSGSEFLNSWKKIEILNEMYPKLLDSSDFLPFIPNMTGLKDLSLVLKRLHTNRKLDGGAIREVTAWAINHDYDSLCFVLNFFSATGITIDDEAVMAKVLEFIAAKGDVKVAVGFYERLIASGQRPTFEMFHILLKLFVDQGRSDLADYVVQNLDLQNVPTDSAVYNQSLRHYALKGDKSRVMELKTMLQDSLTVEDYNAVLPYTWDDKGEFFSMILEEMANRGVVANSETYSHVLQASERFQISDMTSWVLDQVKGEELRPSEALVASFLRLCSFPEITTGIQQFLDLGSELDAEALSIVVGRLSAEAADDGERLPLLMHCLQNMGKHANEEQFVKVLGSLDVKVDTFWTFMGMMRDATIVPTDESLVQLLRCHRHSIAAGDTDAVVEDISKLEREGLFWNVMRLSELCVQAGLDEDRGNNLALQLESHRRTQRRQRLGQTSLRFQLE